MLYIHTAMKGDHTTIPCVHLFFSPNVSVWMRKCWQWRMCCLEWRCSSAIGTQDRWSSLFPVSPQCVPLFLCFSTFIPFPCLHLLPTPLIHHTPPSLCMFLSLPPPVFHTLSYPTSFSIANVPPFFPPSLKAGTHGVQVQLDWCRGGASGVEPAGCLLPWCQGPQLGIVLHQKSSATGIHCS